jgi:hypothetical protein
MKIEENNFFKEATVGSSSISNPTPEFRPMPITIPAESGFYQKDDEKKQKQKGNFFVKTVPSAIIGAVLGNSFAKNKARKQQLPIILPAEKHHRQDPGFEQYDYYKQMEHLSNNLKVIFTPLSVVYVVKDKMKDIPLDTIEVDEMNEDMYEAWKRKDYSYYKNLILNKMYSEIQFAEKAFAKKILEKQMGINKAINKESSECYDLDFDDLTDIELYHYASLARDFFSKSNIIIEKMANVILSDLEDEDECVIAEAKLERPFDKYAGVITDTLSLLPFHKRENNISSLQGKFLNPNYLKNNVKIGFFPDRVIFVVDGKIVSSLPVISMNEEGFVHFEKKDTDFFKSFFVKEVRKGIARLNDKFPSPIKQEKTAEEKLDEQNIFVNNNVHPVVYFLLMTAKYGYEWVDFDAASLVQIIEKDFCLSRPIGDIPLNKILSVKVASNGDVAYTSRHAFEKVIRSFNNKPIDFFARETQDLDLEDFVFGLDVLNRVTPYDNTYDNFSPEVYDYMVKILADKGNYIWGVNVSGTSEEVQFITLLNYSLLSELNKRFTELISNSTKKNDIIRENELIFNTSLQLISMVQKQLLSDPKTNVGDFVRGILNSSFADKNVAEVIIRQVVKNIVLDAELDKREQMLINQLTDLGLHNQ